MLDDLVACVECDTGYHSKCWDFNKGCAVYACDSKEAKACKLEDLVTNGALTIPEGKAVSLEQKTTSLVLPKIDTENVPSKYPNMSFFDWIKRIARTVGEGIPKMFGTVSSDDLRIYKEEIKAIVEAGEGDLEFALSSLDKSMKIVSHSDIGLTASEMDSYRIEYIKNQRGRKIEEYEKAFTDLPAIAVAAGQRQDYNLLYWAMNRVDRQAMSLATRDYERKGLFLTIEQRRELNNMYVEERYSAFIKIIKQKLPVTDCGIETIMNGLRPSTISFEIEAKNAVMDDFFEKAKRYAEVFGIELDEPYSRWQNTVLIPQLVNDYIGTRPEQLLKELKQGKINYGTVSQKMDTIAQATQDEQRLEEITKIRTEMSKYNLENPKETKAKGLTIR